MKRAVLQRNKWYDTMHWDVDWHGLGNLSWPNRKSHLAAFFTTQPLASQTQEWTEPRQCWLVIDALDSSQDAVYLHTPNPNQENFPLSFDWVQWNTEIPRRLRKFMIDPTLQFGRSALTWTHALSPNVANRRQRTQRCD